MKNYVKPVVLENDEMFEGVYAASGDCYTVRAWVIQEPATGFDYYVVKATAEHRTDKHHSTEQVLTLTFNAPVTYEYCNSANADVSALVSSGSTISIRFNYHANATEDHGLADIYVKSAAAGLEVTGATLTCNYTCAQHDDLPN